MADLKILGVIGARSGSRSIPHKNIKSLLGKPLFAWIADAAQRSKYLSKLIMSTDSLEYAELARTFEVDVPFIRPAELANDSASDFDFLYHAAIEMDKLGWRPDIILRLPPTSPLCLPEHIDLCVEALIQDPDATSSRTIVSAPKHPYKLWRKNGDYIEPFLSEEFTGLKDAHNLPRQSFPGAFSHVDVIALRFDTLVNKKQMAGDKIRFVEIKKENAIDIDTDIDFLVAEELLRRRLNLKND